MAGSLGGEQQISSQIERNQLDLVIFFRDPNKPKNNEPEFKNIFRLCDMNNIPFATNLATAEVMILALERGDLAWREIYRS